MRELLSVVGSIIGFMLVIFVIQLLLDPVSVQVHANAVIGALANIYHSAVSAFNK